MKVGTSSSAGVWWQPPRLIAIAVVLVLAASASLIAIQQSGFATSGGDPYSVPLVNDTNPDPTIVETTITADEATIDIGNGVTANGQTFNGAIPGPTFQLNVGDTVIVHYENDLAKESGIHWHGIELPNAMDGTPFTQNQVEPGGDFLYEFEVSRPGIYWYHPHHHSSTNQVIKGLYGMILVRDPNEAALQASGVLPSAAQTKPIVLSDMTVCKAAGTNDANTYDDNADGTPAVTAPWAGSAGVPNSLPAQAPPTPVNLCEGPAVGTNPYPIDEDGVVRGAFAAGDIPNVQTAAHNGRTNEGQTVLTNGENVGARAGGPIVDGYVPGALAPGAATLDVQPGQGLRLQLVNASNVRYMRLRLTTPGGALIPLRRVGGEGGLLDNVVNEGGTQGAWVTKFASGEILLPPGTRADVVAEIPAAPTSGVLTLWTRDFQRTGLGFSNIPTVPVMHLNLAGATVSPAYTLPVGSPLRALTGDPVEALGPADGLPLDPATFVPSKQVLPAPVNRSNIKLTQNGTTELGVDDVFGTHDVIGDYMDAPHLGSTRYAEAGDTLDLSVENTTGANHPYHLHGFSIQPISLDGPGATDFVWPYKEFRDNVDVPNGYTLNFKVRLDPRSMPDGTTPGGVLGRWLFHCHIFFHATNGMLGELVIVNGSGNERPDVNVNTASTTVDEGVTATMAGTFKDRDGDPVTLSTSVGTVNDTGGGNWSWTYPTTGESSKIVYITATDSQGLKGQIPFQLNINQAPPVDKAPKIKKLRVSPKQIASSGKPKHSNLEAAKKKSAKIKFTLSEAAKVRFKVKRTKPKHPRAKKIKFSKSLDTAGKQKVRLKTRNLRPGKYKLTARATDDAGQRSKKASTKFKIKR